MILTMNAGSSSLKFAVFPAEADSAPVLRGEIENLDEAPRLLMRDARGIKLADKSWPQGEVMSGLLRAIEAQLADQPLLAIGHRIVHGGADHIAPERVTPALLGALLALTPLDPLHMPRNLAPIQALMAARPALVQVACFDTAFHHTMPPVAKRFGLPRAMDAAGLRRYGFHGLSYEYIAGVLARTAPDLRRVIVAHLGAGASLCALRDGHSIATTTGFSALDGLLMATRCGSLDPGIILHLGRQGRSFAEIEDVLYRKSGLLGVSGISGDIRVLLASNSDSAREAIDLFTYSVALEAGAMASALGGLDGLVFTAGIGEHAASIRAAICARLTWLGLEMDVAANAAGAVRIATPASRIVIFVIPTDEEAMVAHHTRGILSEGIAA